MENQSPSSKDADKGIINELCDWHLEMRSLDEAVEFALHREPFRNNAEIHNSCNNALEKPDWDAQFEYLRESARLHCVRPFLHKHASSQEKANARLMLPSFFDSIFLLLVKTWHLAQARERHVQQLIGGHLETVSLCKHTEARSDRAELDSMRKALKEKCWELALVKQDIEMADHHRQSIEQLLVEVEQDRECETRTRAEVERRLATAQSEFHSRLAETRDALKQAQGALAEARMGLEVAELRRMQGEERSMQLERSLTTFKQQLQSLLQQRINGMTAPPQDGGTTEPVRTRSLSNSRSRRSSRTVSRQPPWQLSGRCDFLAKDEQVLREDRLIVTKRSLATSPPSRASAGQPGNMVPGQMVVLNTMIPPGQKQPLPSPKAAFRRGVTLTNAETDGTSRSISPKASSCVAHERARPRSVARSPRGSCSGSPSAMGR